MARRRSIRRGAWGAVRAAVTSCALAAAVCPVASASTRTIHLTVALHPRDPAALAREVHAVSTPGAPAYHRYLSPRAFGARYGAGPTTIATVTRALRARGLDPGQPSADGLSIPLSVPASALPAGGPDAAAVRSLVTGALPRSARASVQAVIAFGRSSAARPLALRDPIHRSEPLSRMLSARLAAGRATATATSTTGPQPCAAASAAAAGVHANTDQTIAGAYGFGSLYAAGDEGQGVTVAIYELEPDDPADIAAFQTCYGTHAQISYVRVDGGAGSGAGSDEAALDIENLIGFAPRANVLVYQGPNAPTGVPGSGPYDVFSAIINQDRARVVSISWGQCEQQLGGLAEQAESVLFEQAAVQGQTLISAAGDNGAQDCDTGGANSSTGLAVDDPASQPDVVGVGGTTLQAAGPPPTETVWNSGSGGPGGGGGGVSARWPMASDQLDTPGFLHLRTTAARGPTCGLPRDRYCRETPDVSADADPVSGYEVYWNGADTVPEPSGWQALGGTSAAAPLWAALFALADASPACAGSALGFAGPSLYRAAAGDYLGNFHDVTSGENDFAGTSGDRWPAGRGYDPASGLGTPNAAPLVTALCADSIRLASVGGQSSAVGAAVGVALHAGDVHGARLRYSAKGLPAGVRIRSHSGQLTGRPRRPGRYRVRVAVRDGRGARAGRVFTWSIGALPRITGAALTGSGAGRRLALTVTSGRHAPWLRRVRVRLPAALSVPGTARALVRARHQSSVRVAGSVVTISLSSPSPSVTLRLPVRGPELPPQTRLSVGVRAGSTGTSVITAPLTSRAGA
jgi:hypothetical protein